jgi:basic membrane protein A
MFKLLKLTLTVTLLLTVALYLSHPPPATAQAKKIRVTNVVNGTLGDKSFFDSAERGLQRAAKELGIEYKTIQLSEDASKWEAGLDDAMSDEAAYDVLITGTFQMADFMTARADAHPTKKFVVYDTAVDYTKCKCANVYSILYKQNEGSYLAGVFAGALLKEGKLKGAEGKKALGAIGGLQIPVIDDFIVGYAQGAKFVDPSITVLTQYVGGDKAFNDPARGKEIALSLYDKGAAIIFQIAAGSGTGVIEAAADRGLYVVGVDSDQAAIFLGEKKEKLANTVVTSMLKNVDNSLFLALSLEKDGKVPYGTVANYGLKEGGVGLAINDISKKVASESVLAMVKQAESDILSGKVQVNSAFAPAPVATPAK